MHYAPAQEKQWINSMWKNKTLPAYCKRNGCFISIKNRVVNYNTQSIIVLNGRSIIRSKERKRKYFRWTNSNTVYKIVGSSRGVFPRGLYHNKHPIVQWKQSSVCGACYGYWRNIAWRVNIIIRRRLVLYWWPRNSVFSEPFLHGIFPQTILRVFLRICRWRAKRIFLSTKWRILCTAPTAISFLVSCGVYSVANFPEIVSITNESSPCQSPRRIGFMSSRTLVGSRNVSFGTVLRASCINAFQSGAIINPATFFSIGVLSLFPAQAPATSEGVPNYPRVPIVVCRTGFYGDIFPWKI